MARRIVYVHGNATTHWSSAWAAWLKDRVEAAGHSTFFETMPDSINARAEYWLPFMRDHIGVGTEDILVGWSSGAVAAMRFAETNPVGALVLVSPCHTDLDDEMEKMSGYFAMPWDWPAIRKNVEKIFLISGDDDPFIPQNEFLEIAGQLSADHVRVALGGHFMEQTEFAEVLAAIESIDAGN